MNTPTTVTETNERVYCELQQRVVQQEQLNEQEQHWLEVYSKLRDQEKAAIDNLLFKCMY